MKIQTLSTFDAAKILGVQPQTLNNWRNLKRGPAYQKNGCFVEYDVVEIIKFNKARKAAKKAKARRERK